LAKLTVRAIMLMEDAGGQVVGLTWDGASLIEQCEVTWG